MSEEQLKAFLEKVKADTSLQEKLKAAADVDAALAIAKDAGFSISADVVRTKISDEELEGAAGGREAVALRRPTRSLGKQTIPNLGSRSLIFHARFGKIAKLDFFSGLSGKIIIFFYLLAEEDELSLFTRSSYPEHRGSASRAHGAVW